MENAEPVCVATVSVPSGATKTTEPVLYEIALVEKP